MINVQTLSETQFAQAIRNAYDKLSDEDRENIRMQAQALREEIRKRDPDIRFGFDAALMVIAAVGMGLNDNRIRFVMK